jgi:predicted PurR-regulated permease PerM
VRWLAPRAAAVGILCALVVAAVALILLIVVPTITHQVSDTVSKAPEYARVVQARVTPLIERLNLRYPAQFAEVRRELEQAVKTHLPEIVAPLTRIVQVAFSSALGLALAILNLVVIPVFAIYLLYDMNRINAGLAELVPHRCREYAYSRARAIDALLAGFIRGQVTVCLILGAFYAVALTACGVPMGVPVGLLVGSFNLIPYMSTLLGLPLALVLSWVDDQSWRTLLTVAALFFFGQLVEGNFITPRIVGEKLGLHAVVTMLAVLIGGTLFGFIGMLLAMPVTAALSVFWADLRAVYLGSAFFHHGARPPEA